MKNSALASRALAVVLAFSLVAGLAQAFPLQGPSGGARSLQGQDITGGAAIVFKKPQPARHLVGGAAALMVRRQVRRSPPTVARNTGWDPRTTATGGRVRTTVAVTAEA